MRRRFKRRRILNGKLLKVYIDTVRLPNGLTTRLEFIEHPGAVAVVPFLSQQKIILIRQWRPVIRKYIWEVPAGTLEEGESHYACAKREITEEIAYSARRVHKIGEILTTPGFTTEKILLYAAKGLQSVTARPERDEVIRSKIFTVRRVRLMYKAGLIIDAKTIAALSKCGVL